MAGKKRTGRDDALRDQSGDRTTYLRPARCSLLEAKHDKRRTEGEAFFLRFCVERTCERDAPPRPGMRQAGHAGAARHAIHVSELLVSFVCAFSMRTCE